MSHLKVTTYTRTRHVIMKYLIYIIISIISITSYAQDTIPQRSQWLLGVIFKLETKVKEIQVDSQKIQNNILKCDATINKCETIISQAQQKGNVEAEKIAQEAFQKATEAKKKNIELLKAKETNKANAEIALAVVKKEILNTSSSAHKITSVISNFSGNVQIKKANLEKIYYLDKNNPVFLEEGDIITTDNNSKVEMQFLEGRGNVTIGESSKLKMEEDSSGTQIMNLIHGKVNVVVDKIDDYQQWMDKKLSEYKEPPKKLEDDYERLINRWKSNIKKKFEVRTPAGCVCVRGTQLIVSGDDQKGTEIIVLEGSIELKGTQNDKTVIINEGYKGIVTINGEILEPQKIDISNIEKWWKE